MERVIIFTNPPQSVVAESRKKAEEIQQDVISRGILSWIVYVVDKEE